MQFHIERKNTQAAQVFSSIYRVLVVVLLFRERRESARENAPLLSSLSLSLFLKKQLYYKNTTLYLKGGAWGKNLIESSETLERFTKCNLILKRRHVKDERPRKRESSERSERFEWWLFLTTVISSFSSSSSGKKIIFEENRSHRSSSR